MGDFVDTPMKDPMWVKDGKIPEGSAGDYDGHGGCPSFAAYPRTSSSNGVKEKFYEKAMPKPSGEEDHF